MYLKNVPVLEVHQFYSKWFTKIAFDLDRTCGKYYLTLFFSLKINLHLKAWTANI